MNKKLEQEITILLDACKGCFKEAPLFIHLETKWDMKKKGMVDKWVIEEVTDSFFSPRFSLSEALVTWMQGQGMAMVNSAKSEPFTAIDLNQMVRRYHINKIINAL